MTRERFIKFCKTEAQRADVVLERFKTLASGDSNIANTLQWADDAFKAVAVKEIADECLSPLVDNDGGDQDVIFERVRHHIITTALNSASCLSHGSLQTANIKKFYVVKAWGDFARAVLGQRSV